MTKEELQSLTIEQLNGMTQQEINDVAEEVLKKLTADEIKEFPEEVRNKLSIKIKSIWTSAELWISLIISAFVMSVVKSC